MIQSLPGSEYVCWGLWQYLRHNRIQPWIAFGHLAHAHGMTSASQDLMLGLMPQRPHRDDELEGQLPHLLTFVPESSWVLPCSHV